LYQIVSDLLFMRGSIIVAIAVKCSATSAVASSRKYRVFES